LSGLLNKGEEGRENSENSGQLPHLNIDESLLVADDVLQDLEKELIRIGQEKQSVAQGGAQISTVTMSLGFLSEHAKLALLKILAPIVDSR